MVIHASHNKDKLPVIILLKIFIRVVKKIQNLLAIPKGAIDSKLAPWLRDQAKLGSRTLFKMATSQSVRVICLRWSSRIFFELWN